MDTRQSGALVRYLRQLVDPQSARELSDALLLDRFASERDDGAFAVLVERHGRLVWEVCRHILHDDHDAEDAFQVTFLVLARKAGSIRKKQSIASWLYGVAYRVAQKARVAAARRRSHEAQAPPVGAARPASEMAWRELQGILDDELTRLPEKYKSPFILCCLEGKSKKEAADELGWKEGTVSSRLAHARKLLQLRLSRRGVTLSALLCGTALAQNTALATTPPLLAASTVKAALSFVSGSSAQAGQTTVLAEEVLRAMAVTRLKLGVVFLVLLVAGGAVWALRPLAEDSKTLDDPQTRRDPMGEVPVQDNRPEPAAEGKMIVAGQALGRNGRPLAGAQVAVLAGERREIGHPALDIRPGHKVFCSAQTDSQGRFLLALERPSLERYYNIGLLATAPGYAPSWSPVSHRDSYHEAQQVQCELEPGQVVYGRLIDAQGKPARAVRVDVVGMAKRAGRSQGVRFRGPEEGLHGWPASATTDDLGRFLLRDLGSDCDIDLQVHGEHVAPQWLLLRTNPAERQEEVTFVLEPRRILEGKVTTADTGKPMPHGRLFVISQGPGASSRFSRTEGQADAQGRFQLSPFPGQELVVVAYPAEGAPYLNLQQTLKWPAGRPRRALDFPLPRGVLVTGQVVEEATGQPVAGARVEYRPRWADNSPTHTAKDGSVTEWGWLDTQTRPDGTFQIVVHPGPGWLLVKGPGSEYVHVEVSAGQLAGEKTAGTPYFPDALVPLDLKPDAGVPRVVARLRRGVLVRGSVLGNTGQPVASAFVLAPTYVPREFELRGDALPVRQGRFEVPGCDPDKTVPLLFYDTHNLQGAFVELSPKQAAVEPVQVRLAPCGSASVRFVDPAGQPILRPAAQLDVLLRPGPTIQDSFEQGGPAYLTVPAGRFFGPQSVRLDPKTGVLTFSSLIPGATYLVQADEGRGLTRLATFTVQPGQERALPDIVFKNVR
jgi:RNA polymerase sigma factor (sigma-70 family)